MTTILGTYADIEIIINDNMINLTRAGGQRKKSESPTGI